MPKKNITVGSGIARRRTVKVRYSVAEKRIWRRTERFLEHSTGDEFASKQQPNYRKIAMEEIELIHTLATTFTQSC